MSEFDENQDDIQQEKPIDLRLGNQFWKARSKHGRNPIFEDENALWNACCEYFQWVDDNPLYEDKVFSYQGDITKTQLAKMRAMTLSGLCIFIDIDFQSWKNYKEKKGFFDIVTRVEEIIKTQKFEGAAAGILNPSIIARDLGLMDKSVVKHTGNMPVNVIERKYVKPNR